MMQDTLAEEFNETAAAAFEAFPVELGGLVVLLPSVRTPVFVSPELADYLTGKTAVIRAAINDVMGRMRKMNGVGIAITNYPMAGTLVDIIALDKDNARGAFSSRYTREMRTIYTLDHEIGHHILKNGHPSSKVSRQQAEAACDAFAMLRHIQRFGKDTGHAGSHAEGRAYAIILLSDIDHYTADAIQGAIKAADEMDISGLSLRETAALAEKIADDCRVTIGRLEKISNAFLPAHESFMDRLGGKPDIIRKFYDGDKEAYALFCRETVAVMDKHRNDPDIFEAGQRFLSYPPVKDFIMNAAKKDKSWRQALGYIGVKNAAPRRGILRRLGLKRGCG